MFGFQKEAPGLAQDGSWQWVARAMWLGALATKEGAAAEGCQIAKKVRVVRVEPVCIGLGKALGQGERVPPRHMEDWRQGSQN